eukprot:CAMPEP_0170566014 /NCGR_PEP_ID=MMETSP0211-20121228/79563_1 /TAXON_ID=311385 /ORGANISM="Pseudokeronopsis sp., Strain OXSARD2" /LENGTH=110 /DNA_ID=CAMNT_0010887065 /DNA_START=1019 /DNA_END=1351 /DNA_ORIENTATION=+
MGQESLEGTYLEERIKKVTAGMSSGKTYDRRAKDQEEEELVTKEMRDFVAKECEEVLLFFGYANITSEDQGYVIKNPTQEQKELFGKFKENNKANIAWHAKDKETIDKTL